MDLPHLEANPVEAGSGPDTPTVIGPTAVFRAFLFSVQLAKFPEELQEILRNKNSLLVLGPPGSGKTTLLREITREHDEGFDRRVWIVDTSSEIAGHLGFQ